jgi:ribosomal protein L3 glutamine methyltransferase
MVTATDIDDGALEVAEKNLQRLDLQNRVLLVKSDVFDNLADKRYDIIISNPPYVGESEYEGLPDEYKQEPALGLTAGSDGLDCVRKILADAARHLNPHGILIVEVGNSQPALEKAFPHIPFMWLEFERGGEGVFLLECEQLLNI